MDTIVCGIKGQKNLFAVSFSCLLDLMVQCIHWECMWIPTNPKKIDPVHYANSIEMQEELSEFSKICLPILK